MGPKAQTLCCLLPPCPPVISWQIGPLGPVDGSVTGHSLHQNLPSTSFGYGPSSARSAGCPSFKLSSATPITSSTVVYPVSSLVTYVKLPRFLSPGAEHLCGCLLVGCVGSTRVRRHRGATRSATGSHRRTLYLSPRRRMYHEAFWRAT